MTKHIIFLLALIIASAPNSANAQANKPRAMMSIEQAYKLSLEKKIILIDIRRPEEWQQTGIPQTAKPVTMHQNFYRFLAQFRDATGGGFTKPIAIICARGVRTRYMQALLAKHGYPNLIDVGAGMLGSPYGPGWLKTGLPIKNWPG